ncbi:MAG TPA: HEAT repeat domain-containing protein [Gemmataceae bacterium]|nr:HEAT repeat domain-containing protein [Gemmataceae bacterium]
MRNSVAVFVCAALTLSAAGQPPKGSAKADAKMDPKAATKADAKLAPKADLNAQPGVAYPSHVAGKTLDQWIKEINDDDPSHRAMAIDMVLQFGPNGKKAIPTLIRQVKQSPDVAPKAHAMYALEQLVPLDVQTYARDAVDALCGVGGLDSTQGTLRIRACRALAAIGPAARAAVPRLVRLVEDRLSNEVRQWAAYALGRVAYDENNNPDLRALSALAGGIDDVSREVRLECLQSITNLGPPAGGTANEFKTKLERRIKNEKDNSAKIWVRVALMRMDPTKINDANLNPIAALMKEKGDTDIRIQAARAIGFIGAPAKSKIPELVEALSDSEPLMVWQALWSLARMEKEAQKALPQIEKIAADDKADPQVREAAKKAMQVIKGGK